MPFPGYPLDTTKTNATPTTNVHAADHNSVNAAANDLQGQVNALALEDTDLQAQITAEAAARVAADGTLTAADTTLTNTKVAKAGDTMTGSLTAPTIVSRAAGTPLRLCDTSSAHHVYASYWDAASTRYGYIGYPADPSLYIVNEVAGGSIVIDAPSGGAIQFHGFAQAHEHLAVVGGNFYHLKTTADANLAGVQMNASNPGRIESTTTTLGSFANFVARHESAASANGELFHIFQNASATTCGYISQSSGNNSIFNAGSGGQHIATSDYRFKDDLGPVDDPIGRLMQLRPKHLRWIPEIAGTEGEFDGFLAHEVSEVEASAVSGEKDAVFPEGHPEEGQPNPQGLDEKRLVPLLTAALQEALTKIEDLTARIAVLEAA